MDFQRIFIYAGIIIVGFLLWQNWEHDYPPVQTAQVQTAHGSLPNASQATGQSNGASAHGSVLPSVPGHLAKSSNTSNSDSSSNLPSKSTATTDGQFVTVTTDLLKVVIDTHGGNVVQADLLSYPKSLKEKDQPTQLLNDKAGTAYTAQSYLVGKDGPDSAAKQVTYTVDKTSYQLASGQSELAVTLHWKNSQGLDVNKVFTFKRDSYAIDVGYTIDNKTSQVWQGNTYNQISRDKVDQDVPGMMHFTTYMGAAISTPEKHYQKVTFADIAKENLSTNATGGWAAMLQHYFVAAWAPSQKSPVHYYSQYNGNNGYTIGLIGPQLNVAAGQKVTSNNTLYVGPAIAKRLENVAPNLQLAVDYGWLWPISAAIFWLLTHIHNIIGNWGWSIILVTLVIKGLFYKLSATSYRSMGNMRRLQPKIAALKERHGEDKQKFSQEMMALYRKEKVNPLSGCLPIVVQIPVFLGLYYVLIESVELRQAPFMLWIHDLAAPDPYFILPVLMGLSMLLQQRLNPAPPDPMQAKMMMALPVVFTVMFLYFPAGLVLYWLVNNLVSVTQQWFIMRQVMNGDNKKKKK